MLLSLLLSLSRCHLFLLTNIDPALRSRLEAIYLVALFPCSLLNEYSFDDVVKPFITDLKKLSAVSVIAVCV